MESVHEMAAQWVVIVTLTIMPVKGKPQDFQIGKAPVTNLESCHFLGMVSKMQYDELRKIMQKKGRKFKNIRTFKVSHTCTPYLQET